MDFNIIDAKELGFGKLFQDYLNQSQNLSHFFSNTHLSKESLNHQISVAAYTNSRTSLVDSLIDFNKQFDASEQVLESINSLKDENTYTIVTGQQVVFLGGPLFSLFKTISAIAYAKKASDLTGKKIIPVFWLADEDHDYEEIRPYSHIVNDEFKTYKLPEVESVKTAAEVGLTEEVIRLVENIFDDLQPSDFKEDIQKLVQLSYAKDSNHLHAFGKLFLKLFGKYGLILAGSNTKSFKEQTKDVFKTYVDQFDLIHKTIRASTDKLVDSGYHKQVDTAGTFLFKYDDDQRIKLNPEDISGDLLFNEIEKSPELFSPNVCLRPILQDVLLPNLAYVAGPGEIAYYAQLKELYPIFGKNMPLILNRMSATLLEHPIKRNMDKLHFNLLDYRERNEQLHKKYIEHTNELDINAFFSKWQQDLKTHSQSYIDTIAEKDPSLKKSALSTVSSFNSELGKLRGKLQRSIKHQEETNLNRINKIAVNLFPEQNLQERSISFLYYINKYGLSFIDELLELSCNEDISRGHFIIKI